MLQDIGATAPLEDALFARLRCIAARHARPALASSLGAEDMLLLDAIARAALPIDVFVIDTGRLHDETLQLLDAARTRYGKAIEVWRPLPARIDGFVAAHGLNGFYDGIAERH